VDVDGRTEVDEDLVERPESGVVAPAVDVGGLNVQDLFTQSLSDELRDTDFARSAGSGDDSRVGGFPVRDGLEDAREVVEPTARYSMAS